MSQRGDCALVWFRADLRLDDNPALLRAITAHRTVVPVFIWAPEEEAPWLPGAASRWWLHHSLEALRQSLVDRGSKLVLRNGPTAEALTGLASEVDAHTVYWNRRYEPSVVARDDEVRRRLEEGGVSVEICPGNVLFEPGTVLNSAGKPFQVFTAFWRACQNMADPAEPASAPTSLPSPERNPASLELRDFDLLPTIDWSGGLRETWQPGESGAWRRIRSLLDQGLETYEQERDRPDHEGTSRLSPHLHFGEISARRVWQELRTSPAGMTGVDAYLRQLAWREFSYHLLVHLPQTTLEPLRPEFRLFPWRVDEHGLTAWTKGATGYPLVDAGMRELWHTGWMHNRVRMVTASFLVKHLMIPWLEGAVWFWDTLVDADLANNTMGWQWTAGCGADAAPYHRIFNPVLQGEKFDADGEYVRRWVPELAGLPAEWIHKPWQAPPLLLAAAGIELGKTYPAPIVGHDEARKRALKALAGLRR
jgi:deoxyribodipyrimidine photo-lyase